MVYSVVQKLTCVVWRIYEVSTSLQPLASSRHAPLTKWTLRSEDVMAKLWGFPVASSASSTAMAVNMSSLACGTVSGYESKKKKKHTISILIKKLTSLMYYE